MMTFCQQLLVASVFASAVVPTWALGASNDASRGAQLGAQHEAQPEAQRKEDGGIAVEWSFVTGDGGSATTSGVSRLAFKDANTGRALSGFRPAAWMLAQRSAQASQETSCEAKAQQLVAGSLGSRADVDLNTYRLVTLNQDNTVAFINPHVRLKNSKLESIVSLSGRGYDWAYLPAQHRLVVTLRDEHALIVIDTVTRRLAGRVDFAKGSLPTRLVADGANVWVGLDGTTDLALVDVINMKEISRASVGRGLHTLALAAKTNWLFVTNADDDSVSVIDRATHKVVSNIKVGKTPVAAAWSEAAQRLAVVSINGGAMEMIDPVAAKVSASVVLAPGVVNVGLFDQGRYALVINQLSNRVTLIDLASATTKGEMEVAAKPDQISFSREFAYIRGQGTAKMSVLNLQQARTGRLQAVAVPMGQRAPEEAAQAINVASVVASAPEGNGVLVANAADAIIYRYAEGLMVPVGNFSNYKREARALMVLDDSLVEGEPGVFRAATQFPFGGRYDVIVKNLRPAVTLCFSVDVLGPDQATANKRIASLGIQLESTERVSDTRSGGLSDGQHAVRVVLTNTEKQPITDIADGVLLAMQVTSQWQSRAPLRHLGSGRYEAIMNFPPSGTLAFLLSVPSLDVGFATGRVGHLTLPANNLQTTQLEMVKNGGQQDGEQRDKP
jgi:YVTN family beta-propeller protein